MEKKGIKAKANNTQGGEKGDGKKFSDQQPGKAV